MRLWYDFKNRKCCSTLSAFYPFQTLIVPLRFLPNPPKNALHDARVFVTILYRKPGEFDKKPKLCNGLKFKIFPRFNKAAFSKTSIQESCILVNGITRFQMKRSPSPVPTFDSMLLPTIQALQILGGSGTTEEIYDKVVQLLNLPDEVLEISQGNTSQSKVEYRLAFVFHMKKDELTYPR